SLQKVEKLAGRETADDLLVLLAPEGATDKLAKRNTFYQVAGNIRSELGRKYADRHKAFDGDRSDPNSYRWMWVTDFPMFEWDEEEKRYNAAHHPFTSPLEQDMEKVLAGKDLDAVRARAYDVVLNGTELGSGSIRIHRQDVQKQIFKAMGISE